MHEADKEYGKYLNSPHWLETKQERKKLDGYTCSICKTRDNLQVHHKTYERIGNEDVGKDLITLCRECHEEIHRIIDNCKIEINSNARWYRNAVRNACEQSSKEYIDKQAGVISRELAKCGKKQWRNMQTFMSVFRSSIKVDTYNVIFPSTASSGLQLHSKAIQAGATLRKSIAKKQSHPNKSEEEE